MKKSYYLDFAAWFVNSFWPLLCARGVCGSFTINPSPYYTLTAILQVFFSPDKGWRMFVLGKSLCLKRVGRIPIRIK